MSANRISEEALAALDRVPAPLAAGFVMIPVAAPAAVSPLQALYQQIYQQAVAATQKPALRDLFAIMN